MAEFFDCVKLATVMNVFDHLEDLLTSVFSSLKRDRAISCEFELENFSLELPKESSHGDIATNVAMVMAKRVRMKPKELAKLIVKRLLEFDLIESATIAGPGFINIHLDKVAWHSALAALLEAGSDWGNATLGANEHVNIEFVSANPTGPLHVGHLRGAVLGDVMANLLMKVGYQVTREYYVNDAGAQTDFLARSVHFRYREACGDFLEEMPSDFYPGDYLKEVGAAFLDREGAIWKDKPEKAWLSAVRSFAIEKMMELIRSDLSSLGIKHDVFFFESELHRLGMIHKSIADLERRGLIYKGLLAPPKGKEADDWESRPQTLFRAKSFGDDVDRPLKKSDGSYTYFAADVAYHHDKLNRGFTKIIDVWGADHGGYVKRIKAAVEALTNGKSSIDVKVCNLVKLTRDGEPVKMSKRSGNFVTLRELINEVGSDAVRFMMLMQKSQSPLDFDLKKVLQQSAENPVFYVQYAHARIRSLIRRSGAQIPGTKLEFETLGAEKLARLTHPGEINLIRKLAAWPRTLVAAAHANDPHRITYFLYDLASAFHSHWNYGNVNKNIRFLVEDDSELTQTRLALCYGVLLVIVSGLSILGVEPLEEMR